MKNHKLNHMDDEQKELMEDYGLDEDQAETAQELIGAGLILCQKNYQAPSGSIAVVLIGDDATLKEIKYESDGLLLMPRSTNQRHNPYKLGEGDEFKVLGTFVKKLEFNQ